MASYDALEGWYLVTTFSLNIKGETTLLGVVAGEITSRAGGTSRKLMLHDSDTLTYTRSKSHFMRTMKRGCNITTILLLLCSKRMSTSSILLCTICMHTHLTYSCVSYSIMVALLWVTHRAPNSTVLCWFSFSLGSTDFVNISPVNIEVEGNDEAIILLRILYDDITLEYDDSVLLSFTPDEDDLIEFYENEGEYIRNNVTVHIIDTDRKQ